MRKVTPLVALIILTHCGVNQTDHNSVLKEKDQLQKELDSVRKELAVAKSGGVRIPRSEVRELVSSNTGEKYDIYIKFPPGYDKENKDYPVLYVLDAEVNFGGIAYIVQRLIKDGIVPQILVVGIAYHGETDDDIYYSIRCHDFTPTDDKGFTQRNKMAGGGAEKFRKFMEAELFPFVTANYKTTNKDRAIYGHSFGGLFGFFALLNNPAMFNKYLLLSPSLWWDSKTIFNSVAAFPRDMNPVALYVGTGELEDDDTPGSMVDQHVEMVALIKKTNPMQVSIKSEILENETHRTVFGTGFTKGLRFLYSKPKG